MAGIKELITPEWGGEVYLNQYWDALDPPEQKLITDRINLLFKDGIPFELEHDKIVYAQLFCMLAGLEIAGLKGIYAIQPQCKNTKYSQQMRDQFLDEVAHSIIFTKLAHQLSSPYNAPPQLDEGIIRLCQFFSLECDASISATLVTLIGEGFVETIFSQLKERGIAPKIFDGILKDEQRHLSDSKIYEVLGLPDTKKLVAHLGILEDTMIRSCLHQGEATRALLMVLGSEQYLQLINRIYKRYEDQLKGLGLKPSRKFTLSVSLGEELGRNYFSSLVPKEKATLSFARTVLMNYWKEPVDPTMSATFSLNISALGFFEKKYPTYVLNCLVLQTISSILYDFPVFRQRLSAHQLIQPEQLGVGLVVKLPHCGDQGSIVKFDNGHLLDVREIAQCIEHNMELLSFCFHKSLELITAKPELKAYLEKTSYDIKNAVFTPLRLGASFVSLSSIGHWGYESINSPLFPGEPFKFTLGKVERKQVWNNESKQFEIQDLLPVGLSVDHRVFDANVHIPKLFIERFNTMVDKYEMDVQHAFKPNKNLVSLKHFTKGINYLLEKDLTLGFQLVFASTFFMDSHITIPKVLDNFKFMVEELTGVY